MGFPEPPPKPPAPPGVGSLDDEFAWPTELIDPDELDKLLHRDDQPRTDGRTDYRAILAAQSTLPYDAAFSDRRRYDPGSAAFAAQMRDLFGADAPAPTADLDGPVDALDLGASLFADLDDPDHVRPGPGGVDAAAGGAAAGLLLADPVRPPGPVGRLADWEDDAEPERSHRDHVVVHERGRHRTTTVERVALALVVVGAAALAIASGAAPTGVPVVDAVYGLALTALMVLAGSRTKRWALVVGAACVCMGGSGPSLTLGILALAGGAFLIVRDERNRVVGGVVGGLVGVGALYYPTGAAGSLSILLPFTAVGVVLASGYANAPGSAQSSVRTGVKLAGIAVGGLMVLALLVVLSARASVGRAIDETETAVAAAEAGDQRKASEHLFLAQRSFDRAHARLGNRVLAPIQAVPILGQNFRAIREATTVGSDVTGALGAEVVELDYDRLNRPEGGIDVRVLTGFRGPVHRVDDRLKASIDDLQELETTWLVGPVKGRVEDLTERLDSYQDETGLAALAVDRGPAMLGADGQRRYLILLGNPAEARDLGGHLGNWAEMTFTDGQMELVQVGDPQDLALPATAATEGLVEGFPPSLVDMDPRRFPQNWGSDPDLPTVAELSARLFEERTGRALDGVAYADPDAFAAIVALTGPREVPGAVPPLTITGQNASSFLTSGQYARFPTEQAANPATEQLIREVLDSLTTTQLPDPRQLGDRFGPLVAEGRLAFTSLHDDDAPLLDRMGVERRLPDIEGTNLLGIVNRNANPSKIDQYLHRSTQATFRWNQETGDVTGVVTVRLRNDAPASGLSDVVIGNGLGQPAGTNTTDLTLLTRFELQSVTVDGERVDAQPAAAGTYWRDTVRVTLPSKGQAVVQYRVRGTVAPGPEHRIEIVGQPLVNDGRMVVTIISTDGGTVRGDGGAPVQTDEQGRARVTVSDAAHRQIGVKSE